VYGKILPNKQLSDHPPRLLDIVSQSSTFKATNPRDKLYAIIGLSKEGTELEKYPLINPDYQKTIVQTYIHSWFFLCSLR
jgi:hypothetical protein